MIYFLAPLTGSKDDVSFDHNSLRFGDDGFEQNSDNRDTYDDNVSSKKKVLYYKLIPFLWNIVLIIIIVKFTLSVKKSTWNFS